MSVMITSATTTVATFTCDVCGVTRDVALRDDDPIPRGDLTIMQGHGWQIVHYEIPFARTVTEHRCPEHHLTPIPTPIAWAGGT